MRTMSPAAEPFARSFARRARALRARQATSFILSGAALGAVVGAAWALGSFHFALSPLRPLAGLWILIGALGGFLMARHRRWSDTDVALYLDARLGSAEAITTAIELAKTTDGARGAAEARAREALRTARPSRLRKRLFSRWHLVLPVAAGATLWLGTVPLPPPEIAKAAPGSDRLKRTEVPGLERIEALAGATTLSPEDAARLRELSEEAKKLRADLARGLERREAQARIAKLRDDIARERRRFDDQSQRPAREAALGALAEETTTRGAARALGEGDLVAFDEEMERLANLAERESREAARAALEEAARRARERGGKDLADLLEREGRLFDERSAGAEALRELARRLGEELDPEARKELQDLQGDDSPEAHRRLSQALADALEGLTPEERKRLAERLARSLEGGGGDLSPMTREELEKLSRRLTSEKGKKQLLEQLKRLARKEDPDAAREKALDDAERGSADAERGLGLIPFSIDGPGKPGQGSEAGSGHGKGAGRGSGGHAGVTPGFEAEELRSKANAERLPGVPLGVRSLGRGPARPGETANQVGTGSLGSVGADEVGAVERGEVPEGYREQVGRYFQP